MDNLYFCETLSHLMGLPVRLYRNNLPLFQCSNVEFLPDPVVLVIDNALSEGDSVRFFESNLLFFGRYRISVFHVDENYYRYLYKPEGYNFGGVEQGIGYFGSRSGQSIYTRVIE